MVSAARSPEQVFATAVEHTGDDYIAAEVTLRRGGPEVIATLTRHLGDTSGVARLVARTLLAWTEGRAPAYDAALARMDARERAVSASPRGKPRADGVARILDDAFGDAAVDVLAVRLMKQLDWPRWKAVAVLLYLESHHPETVAPALARLAADTRDDERRAFAVEILARLPEPERRAAVEEERARLAARRRALPEALARLRGDSGTGTP